MSGLDSFLDAIEADPGDDATWLVFADWLEERGEPLSEFVRRTVASGSWAEGFDEVSRLVSLGELQLAACEVVERLLPIFEGEFPEDDAPRRLVAALRDAADLVELRRSVTRSYALALRSGATSHRRGGPISLTPDRWAVQVAAQCFVHLTGWPRRACVQAVEVLAHREAGVMPSRLIGKKAERAIKAATETEFRRLVARLLRYLFEAR